MDEIKMYTSIVVVIFEWYDLFLVAGHMYRTNWGIGHSTKEILEAHKGPFTGEGHKGLYEILTSSWHAQLAINLAMLGSLTIIVSHHMYAMPPYPYLATDYVCHTTFPIYTSYVDRRISSRWRSCTRGYLYGKRL